MPSSEKREALMREPVTKETVLRYEQNYSLRNVTADMVRTHWQLELKLTETLLRSTKEDRWRTFERAYTTLYETCAWLNSDLEHPNAISDYQRMADILGSVRKIYEVGSGKARLITFLASKGYECVATEITMTRGKQFAAQYDNPRWAISDGVNLERFEKPNSYDAVISTQLIEHLHPDDLIDHFKGVFEILRPGGKYVFNTPHYLSGPKDLSVVFRKPKPVCMHLKEYSFREISGALVAAGFEDLKAVPPGKLCKVMPFFTESAGYLKYGMCVENAVSRVGKVPKRMLRLLGIGSNIFMTVRKPLTLLPQADVKDPIKAKNIVADSRWQELRCGFVAHGQEGK